MRMIDGDRLLRELTALSHGQVWPGWTYEGIRLLIERQPTLTPPAEDNNVPTNEPLTLEMLAKSQLLQMLEEKVEVIRMGEMCQAEWATVRSFGDCKTDSGRLCCHELYGKTWIAYRRPPEGEA